MNARRKKWPRQGEGGSVLDRRDALDLMHGRSRMAIDQGKGVGLNHGAHQDYSSEKRQNTK